jgi:hypothetical protein
MSALRLSLSQESYKLNYYYFNLFTKKDGKYYEMLHQLMKFFEIFLLKMYSLRKIVKEFVTI